jgi:hypothetical protein
VICAWGHSIIVLQTGLSKWCSLAVPNFEVLVLSPRAIESWETQCKVIPHLPNLQIKVFGGTGEVACVVLASCVQDNYVA